MTTRARRFAFDACALLLVAGLVALGIWQLERRAWKLALIAQVDARLAAPVAAPGPERWRGIGADDAYRRVTATGTYRGGDTLTQAVTALGPGYWVMTPFVTTAGWRLLVNRGFVPAERRRSVPPPPPGEVRVEGLLRLTEPGGGFLRSNDPAAGRWYSRDVAAIAQARGIAPVAPYFLDAARRGDGLPRGGMTVVRFRNAHLGYALTWFALAAMTAAMALYVRRRELTA